VAIRLNRPAYERAKNLIARGRYAFDARDDWSEHRPSAGAENDFIFEHGMAEYAHWHLGIDDERREGTKGRFSFPYGDFDRVHRCAVLSAEVRAGQYRYQDLEIAVAHLHGEIDALALRLG